MSTGSKIQELRRRNNITQENLADLLGVTRQSISKWESDIAFPDTEKLIKLAEYFEVSIDYLLKEEVKENKDTDNGNETSSVVIKLKKLHYEFISKTKIKGIPLVHINFGIGHYRAKGIIAIGLIAQGFLSIGVISLGLISIGALALGLVGLGIFSLGVLSVGTIALGVVAIGAIAIGLFSIGAISVGMFSYGALSVAKFVAVGDEAYGGLFAFGKKKANGKIFTSYNGFNDNYDKETVYQQMKESINGIWTLFIVWIKNFI